LGEISQANHGKIPIYCKHCFEQRQKVENNYGKRDRKKLMKECENSPETKVIMTKWCQENPDKIYGYYTGYRTRQANENPEEYYRKKCDENARSWRKNNPEKTNEILGRYETDSNLVNDIYLDQANDHECDSEHSFEEFVDIAKKSYCLCSLERENMIMCCKTCIIIKSLRCIIRHTTLDTKA